MQSINTFKPLLLILMAFLLCFPLLQAQNLIENQIVETYYIANADDVNSPFNDDIVEGTVTYRVYLDLCQGCKVLEVFGSDSNPFIIQSSEVIFNSSFGATFGQNLNSAFLTTFDSSPLDSYLTLGAASGSHWAIPKNADSDGSIWSGRIPPQSLTNNASEIDIPITESDGLIDSGGETTEPGGWQTPLNTTPIVNVFGTSTNSQSFNSSELENPFFLRTSDGVFGQNDENIILLAQITTAGDLEFKLNIIIENAEGELIEVVSTEAAEGQQFSNFLFYPAQCGCTDPNFLEYDPAAGCDDGSCMTEIVFGCLNQEACNFNPDANFDIPELCCFVDSCQGLDISILCPALNVNDFDPEDFQVYPNPTSASLFIETDFKKIESIHLYNLQGSFVNALDPFLISDNRLEVRVNDLQSGFYIVMIIDKNGLIATRVFQKVN